MQVNFNQFRAFFLVAKEGGVTKAAEKLFVTQPAVTMQVGALEETLQIKLFNKIGKKIELTEMGARLFAYARRIFEVVEELEYFLEGHMELRQGSLAIGTTRSFARHLMPGLLSRFQENFPGIKVYLKEGNSQEIADGLLGFKYDLGIIDQFRNRGKLKIIPHTKEEFCLVVSSTHKFADRHVVSIHELADEPIIIREEGSGSRKAMLSLLRKHKVKPSVLVEAGSVEFLKNTLSRAREFRFFIDRRWNSRQKWAFLDH